MKSWEEDYGTSDTDALWEDDWDEEEGADLELPDESEDEDSPSWEVSICYLNGETQYICGYDDLPDRVNELTLELRVAPEDMGKVIGRQGRIAKEIRTVVRSYAQRTGTKVSVDIVD